MCSGLANSPILRRRVLVSGQRSMPRICGHRRYQAPGRKGGAASSRLVVGRPASTYMAPTARRRSCARVAPRCCRTWPSDSGCRALERLSDPLAAELTQVGRMTRGVSLPAPGAALTLFVGRRRPARRRSADGPLRLAPVWRGGIWARPPRGLQRPLGWARRHPVRSTGFNRVWAKCWNERPYCRPAGRPRHLLLVRHKNA